MNPEQQNPDTDNAATPPAIPPASPVAPPPAGPRPNRFRSLPKGARIGLIAVGGILIAAILAVAALALSSGDATDQKSGSEGGDNGSHRNESSDDDGDRHDDGRGRGSDDGGSDGSSRDSGSGGSNGSSGQGAPANPPASAVNTDPSAASTITIKDMAFSPATLTVAKNTTVTWRNDDSVAHAIGKADGQASGPHSPQLQHGATYSYSFAAAGTYKYICVIHPEMSGTVVVKD